MKEPCYGWLCLQCPLILNHQCIVLGQSTRKVLFASLPRLSWTMMAESVSNITISHALVPCGCSVHECFLPLFELESNPGRSTKLGETGLDYLRRMELHRSLNKGMWQVHNGVQIACKWVCQVVIVRISFVIAHDLAFKNMLEHFLVESCWKDWST